uniref:Uncharacterized protein n=2 Tax=Picea TaxID=3328 RepID=A0A117NJB9_PICGL|nr:hypothetical protein ABT39_MTgene1180 [Picea glauca]QHR91743.1 hypothetical protein Q903MT_gene5779 [Picea sitchensis]
MIDEYFLPAYLLSPVADEGQLILFSASCYLLQMNLPATPS